MGLPKIERDADADKGPYAVILAPTRELAQQVSWSIRPQTSSREGLMSTRPSRFAQTDEARVQEFTPPLRCALRAAVIFLGKKPSFCGLPTFMGLVHTYIDAFLFPSQRGFSRTIIIYNHYI